MSTEPAPWICSVASVAVRVGAAGSCSPSSHTVASSDVVPLPMAEVLTLIFVPAAQRPGSAVWARIFSVPPTCEVRNTNTSPVDLTWIFAP